jgi:hypothetical protein
MAAPTDMPKSLPIHITNLTAREACIDTMIRFFQGIDDDDESMLYSAFDPAAVFDLTPVSVIGMPFSKLESRDTVVAHLRKTVGTIDSLHQGTNYRVQITGHEAELTCFTLAQHMRKGDGHDGSKPQYLMGNRIWARLVEAEEGLWRIRELVLGNMWAQGDGAAVFAGA